MCTISLCMIVKNEELVLERCLESVKDLVDEIIIVDTGSEDRTKEIAQKYTKRVYDYPWINDFSAARNFSFFKADMDYCMWLDADDVLLPKDREGLAEIKKTLLPEADVVMMQYHTNFDGQGRPIFYCDRERIIRNRAGFYWEGAVHEVITPRGKIAYSPVAITHQKIGPGDPGRNLRIYQMMLENGVELGPRDQYYYARELYDHKLYEKSAAAFETFLKMPEGWVENKIEACRYLAFCYAALEDKNAELSSLFTSFAYDVPRPETCVDIGNFFMRQQRYDVAVFWFHQALDCPQKDTAGFIMPDCRGYLPCIQLCVCYDKLGDHIKAEYYNNKAGEFKPEAPEYLNNKRYFESLQAQRL